MCQAVPTPADRRFRRQCQIGTSVSLLLFVSCSQASLRLHNASISLVLSGIAGAALFAELVSVGMLTLRLRDEFQRILLTRSFIWATLITMALTTIWGFLELHGNGAIPHLDIIWIPCILVSVTAAAKLLIFRQHKVEGE